MLRRDAEPNQRDVRTLPGGSGSDLPGVDFTRYDIVPEARDNLGKQLEPIALLIGDQNA
jgi:hypothetical protein